MVVVGVGVGVVLVVRTAAAEHRVVDGWGRAVRPLRHRPVDVLLPLAAQDLPEGGAHLLVAVGVDDGVHGGVELGEEEEELLVGEDVALGAEDVEEEDDEAGRPADDEGTWGDNAEEKLKLGKYEDWSRSWLLSPPRRSKSSTTDKK